MTAKLNVINDCWRIYAASVLPTAPADVQDFTRAAFFAGVAFMYDILIANSDNEETGMAMLTSVTAELDELSRQMAARKGLDITEVRKAIAAELARPR